LLAALVVAGLRALRAFIAQKLHPGTAQQRRRCLNPGLGPADFEERFLGDAERLQGRRFDFVVLGSGSAGCACAARLARSQAKASVLLVEAGGEAHRSALVRIPRRAFGAWQSEIDWGFRTTLAGDGLRTPWRGCRVSPRGVSLKVSFGSCWLKCWTPPEQWNQSSS
ncbi:unnamed protein product, partial [Effrenium voratum]